MLNNVTQCDKIKGRQIKPAPNFNARSTIPIWSANSHESANWSSLCFPKPDPYTCPGSITKKKNNQKYNFIKILAEVPIISYPPNLNVGSVKTLDLVLILDLYGGAVRMFSGIIVYKLVQSILAQIVDIFASRIEN